MSIFHLDGVGFSLGCPGYLGICRLPVNAVSVWRAGAVAYMGQTECVSAESCPLSRGLLPRNPDGERIDNVLVARIPVEVPTFCGESTNQWVYFTPGRVSHRIVPLEWITGFLTF